MRRRVRDRVAPAPWARVLLAAGCVACARSESDLSPVEAPSPRASAAPAPAPPVSASSARVAPSAASLLVDAAAAPACGAPSLPDCPLQAWMKAKLAPPARAGALPELATALDELARLAPLGYSAWAPIARDGAAAARLGDLAAARASCRGCHEQYKQRYTSELRARTLPAEP